MDWGSLKSEYYSLLGDALALKNEARHLKPSLRLYFDRRELDLLLTRADVLSERQTQADQRLGSLSRVPTDFNGSVIEAAVTAIVAAIRNSVQSHIHEIYAELNDIRSRLNTNVSLALSVAAILLAAVAVLIDVYGSRAI